MMTEHPGATLFTDWFGDLLAAQKEMPQLQKSAINPHFKSRYVPLEELLQTVLPILNAHNFVLLQMPVHDGMLEYCLLHASGERIGATMDLCAIKDDPQAQGSAITYARRYSLMSLLGLTADVDDDAEATRKAPEARQPSYDEVPPKAPHVARNGHERVPQCPQGHGPMRFWKAETSKAGKPIGARYKCTNRDCDNGKGWPETIWASDWEDHLNREKQPVGAAMTQDEMADLPYE